MSLSEEATERLKRFQPIGWVFTPNQSDIAKYVRYRDEKLKEIEDDK